MIRISSLFTHRCETGQLCFLQSRSGPLSVFHIIIARMAVYIIEFSDFCCQRAVFGCRLFPQATREVAFMFIRHRLCRCGSSFAARCAFAVLLLLTFGLPLTPCQAATDNQFGTNGTPGTSGLPGTGGSGGPGGPAGDATAVANAPADTSNTATATGGTGGAGGNGGSGNAAGGNGGAAGAAGNASSTATTNAGADVGQRIGDRPRWHRWRRRIGRRFAAGSPGAGGSVHQRRHGHRQRVGQQHDEQFGDCSSECLRRHSAAPAATAASAPFSTSGAGANGSNGGTASLGNCHRHIHRRWFRQRPSDPKRQARASAGGQLRRQRRHWGIIHAHNAVSGSTTGGLSLVQDGERRHRRRHGQWRCRLGWHGQFHVDADRFGRRLAERIFGRQRWSRRGVRSRRRRRWGHGPRRGGHAPVVGP